MPEIDRYMTRAPVSIKASDSILHARTVMTELTVRHLPVVEGTELVGVVSLHDVEIAAAVPCGDLDAIPVYRIMSKPVTASRGMELSEVANLMVEQKTDCVVVSGGTELIGIFTVIDALQALEDIVRRATA